MVDDRAYGTGLRKRIRQLYRLQTRTGGQLRNCCVAVGPGRNRAQARDEVLLPTYTFTATAEVVTYFGARPILCDSVPGGFNIDPADVERRVTEKTRAILPVHIAGEPCAMDRLHGIAGIHGLHVIEDAAHALPACHQGKRVGTISELTAFSFYATKTIKPKRVKGRTGVTHNRRREAENGTKHGGGKRIPDNRYVRRQDQS